MEFTIGRAFAVLILVAVACARLCEAAEDTNEVSHICTEDHIFDADVKTAWTAATEEAVTKTPSNGFHYKAESTAGFLYKTTIWAIGACNGRLDETECSRCMRSAKDQLDAVCSSFLVNPSVGAQIRLVDCRLRWETYNFDW
ncbi:hypothetical protein M758_3G002400 [Ceratodon purpureus]|uniref:Gnk2-homologous domain-containing protein n=1 Tax=Ceratodon purpureus TaxID=3225 RepID=A0A8T0IFS5_CERPU|nr:hypothetical protein KC19_3G004700 [Ceratodon purpureus]KAG0621212.1 hypothetical protein M758_3G002400 [Ceratodon purpureus]